jgi:hypothetical protein
MWKHAVVLFYAVMLSIALELLVGIAGDYREHVKYIVFAKLFLYVSSFSSKQFIKIRLFSASLPEIHILVFSTDYDVSKTVTVSACAEKVFRVQ